MKNNIKSVRYDAFKSIMLSSLTIIIMISILLSVLLYHWNTSKAEEIVKQKNYAVNYFIDGYFAEINNIIELLSLDDGVQNFLKREPEIQSAVLQKYEDYTEVHKNISFIYSAYESGELVINDYIPPEGYDPRIRPWYSTAMEKRPKISTGVPYREIKSGEWLLSTSMALPLDDGNYSGVISCDSSIEKVTDILKNQKDEIYTSSYSFVTTLDMEIILHHNKSYLNKSLMDIISLKSPLNGEEGLFEYKLEDFDKIAYYSRCKEADWLVFTVVEKQEIINPILRSIFFIVLLISCMAVISGLIQSVLLSRRFTLPIQNLRIQLNSIMKGEWDKRELYDFPDNEIGHIAAEITKLTRDNLFQKSVDLEKLNTQLLEKNSELIDLTVTDQLTGLYNRRKMDRELAVNLNNSQKHKRIFSLIIFDVDFFKKINDDFGHQSGDEILKGIAAVIRENLRPSDFACRWGGEEFLILCPEADLQKAVLLAQRLCLRVEEYDFGIGRNVTMSGGVSEYQENETVHSLVKRADDNLYKAKRSGRNRIVS